MTRFQMILLIAFGVFIVVGVIFFSVGRSGNQANVSNLSVWGFMSSDDFAEILQDSGLDEDKRFNISYSQVDQNSLDEQFVNALADGEAPDVLYLYQDQLLKQGNRLYTIEYDLYPQREFQNTFVEGAEILTKSDGLRAIPVTVDPIVLYWNRDIFTENNVLEAPKNWPAFTSSLIFQFTKKEGSINITQSALPLGTWNNLTNSKAILSALIQQGGGNVTEKNSGEVISSLNIKGANNLLPAESALTFFTDFSNPQKDFYTWNRSLPPSLDYFASGRSAMYLGFASEKSLIKAKNPNLNFDIAYIPQSVGNTKKITYGNFLSLAVPNATKDLSGAVNLIYRLTGEDSAKSHASILGVAPARKDLLSKPNLADAFESAIFDSAVIARSWLDPDKQKTDIIFSDMINSVVSGQKRVSDSVSIADRELSNLLR